MSARLSVREFARQAGCDEKQVRRALEKGLISKGEDNLLAADQVDGQWRKPNRRGISRAAADNTGPVRTTKNVRTGPRGRDVVAVVRTGETPEQAAERIVAEAGELLSLPEALKLKENYLARHQQLSYDLKCGTVVVAADVAKVVGAEYATVRTRMLAIPSEMAPAVFRLTSVVQVEDLLRSVIGQALEELTRDGIPKAT